jgi:2-oxoglutarate dehydrogenase E2 component (dihydrolipoamide succinyltransferase)
MNVDIKIPTLGESVSEATIARIIKPSGSVVKLDEEILELETDKVNQVLHAPAAGVLTLSVTAGSVVKIGDLVGSVNTEGAALPPPQALAAETPVRRSAADFLQSSPVEKPHPLSSGVSRRKMSALRKVIATRLVEVKNTTAMLTTFNEVDMSAIMAIRAQEKESFVKKHGVKLGFMSFFVKAVVAALKSTPAVNAAIDGEEILTYNTYDIGVAVSTDRGLMVPVIRGCDGLNFGQIEKALEGYAAKARSGSMGIDDLRGGSFTITNGGVFGSLLSTPILNPPQAAILGMHAIVKRPVVVDDAIVIRPMMYLALSYDHRLIDGKEGVLFLVHLKQLLEDPSRLLLDL